MRKNFIPSVTAQLFLMEILLYMAELQNFIEYVAPRNWGVCGLKQKANEILSTLICIAVHCYGLFVYKEVWFSKEQPRQNVELQPFREITYEKVHKHKINTPMHVCI